MLRQLNHKQIMAYIAEVPMGTSDDLSKASEAQYRDDLESIKTAIAVTEARCESGRVLGMGGTITVSDKEWEYFKSQLGITENTNEAE